MSLDIIEPTRERLRRGDVLGTKTDQKTDRRAYMALGTFERFLRDKAIAPEHYQAARKLEKHNLGALGVDVRDGEGGGDPCCEFPRSYHAQKLAEGLAVLSKRERWAIEGLLTDQFRDGTELVDIGRRITDWACRKQCKGFGQALVQNALERVADRWGLPLPEH